MVAPLVLDALAVHPGEVLERPLDPVRIGEHHDGHGGHAEQREREEREVEQEDAAAAAARAAAPRTRR